MENTQANPANGSPGVFYPQDFSINTLNLVMANGKKMELKKLLIEMSYYEDIYTFASSGYISVLDAQGFIEMLQLTGDEYIEMNFGKIKDAPNSTIQTFRVYKAGNRKNSGNMNSEGYTLYFCSEELLLSEQTKISKSYAGQKISDIITDVLKDKLKVQPKKIGVIEETTGMYDFVIPRMKPFESISWLSTYARPKAFNTSADMLFFQTKDGFNFRSIQSMYKDPTYATYRYEPKNLNSDVQQFQDKAVTVLEFEFLKTYDKLNEVNSGTFANRLISIDPMTRSFNVTDFDYAKSQLQKLNPQGVLNNLQNRLGKSTNESFDGVLKVATGNANQGSVPYIKQKESGFAKDIFIETYVPLRTAGISLANYTTIKMVIPGDPGITAGRTIQFDLLSLKPSSNKKELDRFYSGKYLVTAVRHILQPQGVYKTVLEIAKDSSNVAPEQTDNSNATIKQGIKA